jgi:hypothetical protein
MSDVLYLKDITVIKTIHEENKNVTSFVVFFVNQNNQKLALSMMNLKENCKIFEKDQVDIYTLIHNICSFFFFCDFN